MVEISQDRALRDVYATCVIFIGTLIIGIEDDFTAYFVVGQEDVTTANEASTGSISIFFRLVGAFWGMLLIDGIGRIRTLQTSLIVYIIAWSTIVWSTTNLSLNCGRALCGIGTGLQFNGLLYVTEVCHEDMRGRVTALRTVFFALGNSLPAIFSYFYHWRVVAVISLIIAITGLFLISFLPESKFWYMSKGQRNAARNSILWFSRTATQEEIDFDLDELERLFRRKKPAVSVCYTLLEKRNLKPLVIGALLHVLTSGAGRLAILTHTQHFFLAFQSTYNSKKLVFLSSIMDVITCSMFSIIADNFKRKTTLHNVLAFMAFTLIGIMFHNLALAKLNISLPILPIILLYLYVLTCLTGLYSTVMTVTSEIVSNENRGVIMNLIVAACTVSCGFYSYVLPYALENLDVHFILLFFLSNVVSIEILVRYCIPETSGKTLYECVSNADNLDDILSEINDEETLLFVSNKN